MPKRSAAVGIEGRSGVYWAGRTTLVRRVEDVPLYNRAFRAWWLAWHDDGTRIEMPPDEITLLLDDEDEPDAEPEPEGDALDEREVITVRFSRARGPSPQGLRRCTTGPSSTRLVG